MVGNTKESRALAWGMAHVQPVILLKMNGRADIPNLPNQSICIVIVSKLLVVSKLILQTSWYSELVKYSVIVLNKSQV